MSSRGRFRGVVLALTVAGLLAACDADAGVDDGPPRGFEEENLPPATDARVRTGTETDTPPADPDAGP
jgi:hypothetical protein